MIVLVAGDCAARPRAADMRRIFLSRHSQGPGAIWATHGGAMTARKTFRRLAAIAYL